MNRFGYKYVGRIGTDTRCLRDKKKNSYRKHSYMYLIFKNETSRKHRVVIFDL